MQFQRRQMTLFSHLNKPDASKEYKLIQVDDTKNHSERFDVVDSYLKDINKYPILTKEEEVHYTKLAQQGNCVARDSILHANLRLVVRIARRYLKSGLPFLDMIEEGNMGLMHALEKFEPDLGYRFPTYAAWWIQQDIERAIMNQSRIVRLPVHVQKQLNQCKRACNSLSLDMDQNPSFEKIANYLGKDRKSIEQVMSYNRSAVSFDAPLEANTEKSIAESLHDNEHEEPIISLEREAAFTELELGLKMLSPIEFEIIIRRFGFMGYNPMTLQEIAHDTGFTTERIRQIQLRSIKFLSKKFKEK